MNKAPPGRSRPKKSSHPPPGELVALGNQEKPKGAGAASGAVGNKKPAASASASSVALGGPTAAKRPRPGNIPFSPTPLGRPPAFGESSGSRSSSCITATSTQVDSLAVDIEPADFLASVQEAEKSGDDDSLEGLLCGAVKHLRNHRSKPDQALILSLMYLAKKRSHLFAESRETIFLAFCSLLKRDTGVNLKAKGNPTVPILVCNLFNTAFEKENVWPETFVQLYIEDSLGERIWVDSDDCKPFIEGILTAFGTKMPSRSSLMLMTDPATAKAGGDPTNGGSRHASPAPGTHDGGEGEDAPEIRASRESTPGADRNAVVQTRYDPLVDELQENIVTIVREQLNKRGQPMDSGSRNLLKFLITVSGIGEVRSLAMQKLEIWLQNPKLGRTAQDLLMAICVNCRQHSRHDVEVMSALTKMRIKSKPLVSHFTAELLNQHPENLRTLLKHTIFNELSAARNPNNMIILTAIFQHSGDTSAETLAEIFQDLLLKDADYLRNLRGLFREIVRTLRHDLAFVNFCRALMQDKSDSESFREADASLKSRFVHSVADLVTLASLLGITPAVRESYGELNKPAKKDAAGGNAAAANPGIVAVEPLKAYQTQIATIQRDSVWWLHSVVPKMFDLKKEDFMHLLHKVLFLESADQYCNKDNWPPEADRSFMIRVASEAPLLDDTLMRILILGHGSSGSSSGGVGNGPNANEALDLVERMVKRAALVGVSLMNVVNSGTGAGATNVVPTSVLKMERLELFETLLNLCAYQHPETSHLPKGYNPPVLAIANLYWKAWIILLIIAAYNPDTFGDVAWNQYQNLRCMMEMVMTSQYSFPPPTFGLESQSSDGANLVQDQIRATELQMAQMEKQEILVYEGYLAKGDITEANSLLLSQLITLDPKGMARRPPPAVLQDLQQTTQSLRLGQLLCKSRQPDFLLDIIQRQGTSQSMPWLADLVESSEGSLDVLPVQCLCEFLLHDVSTEMISNATSSLSDAHASSKHVKKLKKQAQLLQRLQSLLRDRESSPLTVEEVMEYFLKRLSSPQAHQRLLAMKGLAMILEPPEPSRKKDEGDEDEEEEMEVDDAGIMTTTTTLMNKMTFLEPLMKNHGWLLKNLPTLPLFHAVLPQVCKALRKACQIETDPRAISAYLIFVGEHAYRDQDMNDLVLDLSQFLVERSTLVTHVLPTTTAGSSVGRRASGALPRHVLGHLLAIMVDYIRKVRHGAGDSKELASGENGGAGDQVEVQWSSGDWARLHITVVHAAIILLTYGAPSAGRQKASEPSSASPNDVAEPAEDEEDNDEAFHELLEIWFPVDGKLPKAYLVGTRDEALLIYDWIKLRMLRSEVDRLVDVALVDLEASQLIIFVQSFGIPVKCMTRLLKALDKECKVNPDSLEIQDKIYLIQLIRIQHRRGASDGREFLRFLEESLTPGEAVLLKNASGEELEEGEVEDEDVGDASQVDIASMSSSASSIDIASTDVAMHSAPPPGSKKEVISLMNSLLTSSTGSKSDLGLMHRVIIADASPKASSPLGIVVDYLKALADKDGGADLAARMSGNDLWPVSFFATLKRAVSKSNPIKATLSDVAKRLTKVLEGSKKGKVSPAVLATLRSCIDSKEAADVKKSTISKYTVKQSSGQGISVKDKVLSILRTLSSERDSQITQNICVNHPGYLVDWLELLDSEVVGLDTEAQMDLILGLSLPATRGKPEDVGLVPYLLGLMVHQSTWETLTSTIDLLLASPRKSPSLVLDLLQAVIRSPKLWQGRDRKVPKNHEEEDVLNLSRPQIHQVVEMIVEEVKAKVKTSAASADSLKKAGDADAVALCQKAVEHRLTLLKSLCAGVWERLVEASSALQIEQMPIAKPTREKSDEPVWLRPQLLLQFYLQNPQISSIMPSPRTILERLQMEEDDEDEEDGDGSSAAQQRKRLPLGNKEQRTKALMNSYSQLDIATHILLTSMASAEVGPKGAKKMEESCSALRQIAAVHPLLILRQLPLLSTHLRGRSNFTLRELNIRNHLKFMLSTIGILELVQPLVFDSEFAPTFKSCLDAILEVFEAHLISEDRQLSQLAARTIAFCHRFIQHAPEQANACSGVLLSNQAVFEALHHQKSDIPFLANLMVMIAAASQSSSNTAIEGFKEERVKAESTPSSREVTPDEPDVKFSLSQLAPFLRRIARGVSDEEAMDVLEDLNETSKKRHEILEFFMDDLRRLILESASESCRGLAHTLLIRYLQEHPDDSSACVTTFLRCLESENADVVESALKHVPDYALICQTRATEILRATFDVGVTTKKDTAGVISETLRTLSTIEASG